MWCAARRWAHWVRPRVQFWSPTPACCRSSARPRTTSWAGTSVSETSTYPISRTKSSWAPNSAAPAHKVWCMRSRICPRLLCGLLLALAAPATTRAQKSDAERARQAYADGEAAYRLDRFDEAAKRYEEAYRLSKYPTILFDIAQCHRRQYETDRTLDHLRKAIDLYRAFLRDAPTASKRPVAARLVPELEKTLAAETRRRRQELIAKANGAEGLKLAEQLVAEGQTQDAAMVLDRVIAARGNPHEVIVVAFGRRAVVAGLLGQKDVAIEAFKRALTLDPGLAPPGGADRATQEAYQAAKQVLAGKRPLTLSQVPPGDVQPGQPARIGVAVESDPVQMVEQV